MRERKFRAWDRGRKKMGTVINLNTNYCDARLVSEDYGKMFGYCYSCIAKCDGICVDFKKKGEE